jgi:AraC family transcriptional regulator, transcriptional activator of pobA
MKNEDNEFAYRQNSIQIYPLSVAHYYIKTPTPLFRADYSFILFFTNGGGEQQVDNDVIRLKSNDLLFIREGHLNAIKSIDKATDGFFIYIDYKLIPRVINNSNLNYFTYNPKTTIPDEKICWLIKCCQLIIEKESLSEYSLEIKISLLKSFVMMVAEDRINTNQKLSKISEISLNFKECLFQNFKSQRSVKFYAEKLAVSQNYLNRCVNKFTHKSVKQHINEIVINHSKLLLQDKTNNISNIAFDLNFNDPSHFGRLFKKITTQTPSEYRNTFMHDLSE